MESDSSSFSSVAISLIFLITVIIGMWKVFVKAGRPGWAVIIPFYNLYLLLKIAGKPGWWLVLYFIPFVNIIIHAIVSIAVAKAFNKGAAFGIFLLWLLSGIGYLILGFGKAVYVGVSSAPKPVAPQASSASTPPQTI